MQRYNIVIDEIIVASVINTDFIKIKSFLNFKIVLFKFIKIPTQINTKFMRKIL